MSEDPAPVDIADEYHGGVGQLREAHVDDIVFPQVDFRRTARAFYNNYVVLRRETVEGREDFGNQRFPVAEVVDRAHMPARGAVDNDLAARVARRFEQYGVHTGVGRDSGGLCLYGLRAAYFQPVRRDVAVERHILTFERRDAQAVLFEYPAERRTQQALARARHRTLYHQAFRHDSKTSLSA